VSRGAWDLLLESGSASTVTGEERGRKRRQGGSAARGSQEKRAVNPCSTSTETKSPAYFAPRRKEIQEVIPDDKREEMSRGRDQFLL